MVHARWLDDHLKLELRAHWLLDGGHWRGHLNSHHYYYKDYGGDGGGGNDNDDDDVGDKGRHLDSHLSRDGTEHNWHYCHQCWQHSGKGNNIQKHTQVVLRHVEVSSMVDKIAKTLIVKPRMTFPGKIKSKTTSVIGL